MRRETRPTLDLAPIMGLVSLLIPMLLMGSFVPFAVVESDLSHTCGAHGEGEPVDVPTVRLTDRTIVAAVRDETVEMPAAELSRLAEVLDGFADRYDTHGRLVLVPEGTVPYERMIAAMDTARPRFPNVTLAGGEP